MNNNYTNSIDRRQHAHTTMVLGLLVSKSAKCYSIHGSCFIFQFSTRICYYTSRIYYTVRAFIMLLLLALVIA